jgi:5-oxoprolinase (ATP-hydrolysing)/N-methylhydantoinase A
MLEEYKLDDPADPNGQTLSDLVAELQERSERAMRAIIRALPDGTSRVEGLADCQGRPVKMCLTLTIKGDEIIADYEGTEPQLEFGGLNCTMSYTTGDTHYALKCALAPHIPHNEGSTKPLQVLAPEGSILNATFPASVNARTYTGWHLYSLIYAALAELVPDKAMASPGLLQFPRVVGTYPDGKEFNAPIFAGGGRGGSNVEDGIGGFIFPSSASTVSVEVFETASPAMIAFKEWLPDTAGAGKHRGGPAQRITIRKLHGYEPPVRIRYAPIRGVVPGPGLFGGKDGSLDNPTWNGQPITPELEIGRDGWSSFRDQDDTLTFEVPSGGGYGDPGERDPALIERDIELGFVTREGARRDYGYEPEG